MERVKCMSDPSDRSLVKSLVRVVDVGETTAGVLYKHREHQSRKYKQCLFVFFAFVTLLFLLYIPAYHQVQTRLSTRSDNVVDPIPGWNFNTSREVSEYVLPDNSTNVHEPVNLCTDIGEVNKEMKSSAGPTAVPLFLLIVVCSAVENFEQRDAIRKSWASDYHIDYSSVRVVFLLGLVENETVLSKVNEEIGLHNDIIQERFIDSYQNLTLKSILLLKWVTSRCASKSKFIMKTDDDTYVNIPKLVNILNLRKNATSNMLTGALICKARPIIDSNSKWYSPKYMYSGSYYPNYLSGTGYLMSRDIALKLYSAALQTRIFHLEDIFITGICAREAQITPRNHPLFSWQLRNFDPCIYKDIVTSHHMTPDMLTKMFKLLQEPRKTLDGRCRLQQLKKQAAATSYPISNLTSSNLQRLARHQLILLRKSKKDCS